MKTTTAPRAPLHSITKKSGTEFTVTACAKQWLGGEMQEITLTRRADGFVGMELLPDQTKRVCILPGSSCTKTAVAVAGILLLYS